LITLSAVDIGLKSKSKIRILAFAASS